MQYWLVTTVLKCWNFARIFKGLIRRLSIMILLCFLVTRHEHLLKYTNPITNGARQLCGEIRQADGVEMYKPSSKHTLHSCSVLVQQKRTTEMLLSFIYADSGLLGFLSRSRYRRVL